ncbi:LLM class flavin-dependent oxidoreductase [Leptospira stimsonii]|uniref:LLM class flavin-dependent oxidoreductase n=1 Tax=Leptospira stimsonii TaxID=2202203 RepID=A0ABY2N5R0_9LEPT|nr:LLM class flavin-dependent oxidoreductase [Leptospira stimsonii]TGK19894.1 LLM class flavin-dependent oxidoreductase [Leptospira stimsonii]TGM17373.1 LLM class flavin-dependent oxidoreductase [Leptospira stimsonii]
MKLSVLDQSPLRKGGSARQAVLETIELAKLADELGYTRYWVSEHHNIQGLAGSTPEVLISHLAGVTKRIRVGSGGVMLPNHSALKVAENFRMLETLFPGRIDLGLGRASGSDRLTASILNPGAQFVRNDFGQQLLDLQCFLTDRAEEDSIQTKVKAIPKADTVPELWILTSSGESGLLAAHFGLALSFAHFINPIGGPNAVKAYRERFRPSETLAFPNASLGIFVLCAETEKKAEELQAVMDRQLLNIGKGISEGVTCYEEVIQTDYSDFEKAVILQNRGRMVVGTPDKVKEDIIRLTKEYEVEEVVVTTITFDFEDRLRSYRLLANAFDLKPAVFI